MDKPFSTPIHEIRWEDGQYKQGKQMKIPVGLSVYGLTMDDLGTGGEKVIALDDSDYLYIYAPTEKPLERLKSLGSVPERLYRSDDYFGGSNTAIVNDDLLPDDENRTTFINSRILTLDTGKDGKKEIIIVKNLGSVGKILKNVKLLQQARSMILSGMVSVSSKTGKHVSSVVTYRITS